MPRGQQTVRPVSYLESQRSVLAALQNKATKSQIELDGPKTKKKKKKKKKHKTLFPKMSPPQEINIPLLN